MDEKNVILETNQGNIEIKLKTDVAPKACENFVKLIEKGYYNGLIFHRVIKGFMIQGGDPSGNGTGGPGYKFADEKFEGEYARGTVAMANSGPDTNGSQFFITVAPTPWLTGHHTIFGRVLVGQEVVDEISKVQRDTRDKPLEPVILKKVVIKEEVQ